jgi:adenosylcobinamide-GDP ribazoletransferase
VLVAGGASAVVRLVAVGLTLVLGWVLLGATATGFAHALWLPFAAIVGLAAGRGVTWHATRRLGGVTGDVFGAIVEIVTTVSLLAFAAVIAWNGV